MSKWKENFNSYKIGQNLSESLETLQNSKLDKLEETTLNNYQRLIKVLKMLTIKLNNFDPELYPLTTLQDISNYASNLKNYCLNFSQNPQQNKNSLDQANQMADAILKYIILIEPISNEEYLSGFSEVLEVFKKKSNEELKLLSNTLENLKKDTGNISNSIENERKKIDNLNVIIEQQKARLDQAITIFQKQFSDDEISRKNEFKKMSDECLNIFDKKIQKIDNEFKSYWDGIHNKIDEFLKYFNKRKLEVDKIFNAIGTTSFAGNFYNNAERERSTANWLRGISIGFMIIMLIGMSYTLYLSLKEFDVKIFLFRFTTTMLLLIPAIYSAQESVKHRELEKKYRKMHLELSSIDAYLALLPLEQQQGIKAKLTEKFFGKEEDVNLKEDIKKHPLWELINMVIKKSMKE